MWELYLHYGKKCNFLKYICPLLKTHTHQALARAGLAEVTNPSDTILHTEHECEQGL